MYQCSTAGRVRSLDRWIPKISKHGSRSKGLLKGRVLKAGAGGKGYRYVALPNGKDYAVHTLIMLTFVGPRPEGKEVAHKDGDRTNPHLSNLSYKTPKENAADKKRHGTLISGKKHYAYKHGRYAK